MSSLIEYPLVTEQAMDAMDFQNAIEFVVDIDATKPEIAEEVESRYDVTVTDVNTMITPQAQKKATVFLSDDDEAEDVASRIGVF